MGLSQDTMQQRVILWVPPLMLLGGRIREKRTNTLCTVSYFWL